MGEFISQLIREGDLKRALRGFFARFPAFSKSAAFLVAVMVYALFGFALCSVQLFSTIGTCDINPLSHPQATTLNRTVGKSLFGSQGGGFFEGLSARRTSEGGKHPLMELVTFRRTEFRLCGSLGNENLTAMCTGFLEAFKDLKRDFVGLDNPINDIAFRNGVTRAYLDPLVVSQMCRIRGKNKQVFNTIIISNFVDMVNGLRWSQPPVKMLFNNKDMLSNHAGPCRVINTDIPIGLMPVTTGLMPDVLFAGINTVTQSRAITLCGTEFSFATPHRAWLSVKGFPAVSTRQGRIDPSGFVVAGQRAVLSLSGLEATGVSFESFFAVEASAKHGQLLKVKRLLGGIV